MLEVYDDQGVRFEYPRGWELEVDEDGGRTTVAVNAPNGLAFAFVAIDPDPDADLGALADEALSALREEYPGLRSYPANEGADGGEAVGHDVEFVSLDATNGCAIRCRRIGAGAVLFFSQWTDLDDAADHEAELLAVWRSLEETA